MVMKNLSQIVKDFEKNTGAPPLSRVLNTMENIPDTQQLKLIKDILTVAERVSQSAPELDQVVMLIREINSMPLEKLEKLEKLLKRIERIMKNAPQDLLDFLTSLKE